MQKTCSNYIRTPNSKFYLQNKEIVKKELDKYEKYFSISENWWKASKAIENVLFLRSFSYL